MSKKIESSTPEGNKRDESEGDLQIQYEDFNEKILKNPEILTSFRDDSRSSPDGKGNTKGKPGSDHFKTEYFYEEVKSEKKVILLKNYSIQALKDGNSREDYFVLLFFICLYGGNSTVLESIKEKSEKLQSLTYISEPSSKLLTRKDFISEVLICAANQKEDNLIKEIIKNDTIGYIVNIPVVIAFIKGELQSLLKPLLKVVEGAHGYSLSRTMTQRRNNMKKTVVPTTSNAKAEDEKLQTSQTRRSRKSFSAKSAYLNVIIEARFDTIFPHLIELNKLDLVDTLIDIFGEKHINHLGLFLAYNVEEQAIKYYKKNMWDLTESQLTLMLEKKMWNFLCKLDDDNEKMLFFKDEVFSVISDMMQDGKVLTELVLFLTTLPSKGWRQNQVVILMELAKSMLDEEPATCRLIFTNNPILTCAQISYLLSNLALRFRFIQNDLETISKKLSDTALSLQQEAKESSLYAMYLTPLPTGMNMLDYIITMGMKDIVETTFTKTLILDFWDDETAITGSRKDISYLTHAVNESKRFEWKISFKPNINENFAFQFGNFIDSTKYMLLVDVFFFIVAYYALDDYLYRKMEFMKEAKEIPNYFDTLPEFYFDSSYAKYPNVIISDIVILANYWLFFIFRCIHIAREGHGMRFVRFGYYAALLLLTLFFIQIAIFNNYQITLDGETIIILIVMFTRIAITYLIFCSLLGFQGSGTAITVVSTIFRNMLYILVFLSIYMLFYAESMYNLFNKVELYKNYSESFFTLVEILFGSIEFENEPTVSPTLYFTANLNTLLYAFTSAVLCTFLLIAYLSNIYNEVQTNASYTNTNYQYYFLLLFSKLRFKGFYTFPPLISVLTLPFLFFYSIPRLSKKVNMFLLMVKYYLVFVPFQVMRFALTSLLYYAPILYLKNIVLILLGKGQSTITRALHLVGWVFFGPLVIIVYMVMDTFVLLKVMNMNFTTHSPQDKILNKVSDDNVIYIHRYECLRRGILDIIKDNPDRKNIPYLELLNYLMNGGKISGKIDQGRSSTQKKEIKSAKARLIELIKKHTKKGGSSKWLKSVYAAKKKFFIEILDGFQNFKSINMKTEDAFIEGEIVLSMLDSIDHSNIAYLRGRQIFVIQTVLLSTQSKDQISIINKIEELEKKVDLILKYANTPVNKELKLQENILNY